MRPTNWLQRFRRRFHDRRTSRTTPVSTIQRLESRALLAATIQGFVFDDINTNGVFDPFEESPLSGVVAFASTVPGSDLFDPLAERFASEPSDANGLFTINVPFGGDYHVGADLTTGRRLTIAREPVFQRILTPFQLGSSSDTLTTVTSLDVDQDSDQDLIAVIGNKLRLLKNDGQGNFPTAQQSDISFSPVGGIKPGNIVVGNFDGVGGRDIAFADRDQAKVYVCLNQNGSFGSPITLTINSAAYSLAVGQLDGDATDELIVTQPNRISIFLNPSVAGSPSSNQTNANDSNLGGAIEDAVIEDLNNDGKKDIAFVNSDLGLAAILFGNGSGGFTASTENEKFVFPITTFEGIKVYPRSIAAGDLSGDGLPDLAVAFMEVDGDGQEPDSGISILSYAGSLFQQADLGTGPGPLSVELSDFDNDGDPDVVVQNGTNTDAGKTVDISAYRNDGGFFFERVKFAGVNLTDRNAISRIRGLFVTDLDGDGFRDIVSVGSQGTAETERRLIVLQNAPVALVTGLNVELGVDLPHKPPTITSSASVSIPENTTTVLTVTASDEDAPSQTLSFSISGGADQNKFEITSEGTLKFVSAPDFENPTDVGANNVYQVIVRVSDGVDGADTREFSVSVTGVNDNAPVFQTSTAIDSPERRTFVTTVVATDADLPAQNLTYSLTGGADQAKFSITSGGELSFLTSPRLAAPSDVGGDNTYEVVVTANDNAGRTTSQTINVNVIPAPLLDRLVVRFNSATSVTIERTLDLNTETQTLAGSTSLLLEDSAKSITLDLPDTNDSGVVLADVTGADGLMKFTGSTLRTITFNVTNANFLHLNGNSGNDSIKVSSLDAAFTRLLSLNGGLGNDTLDVTTLTISTELRGNDGNDTLKGGGSEDFLSGGAGNDVLTGGAGTDNLSGGDGNDNIDGGDGNNDFVSGGLGNDTLKGGNGVGDILFESIQNIHPLDGSIKLTGSALTGSFGKDSISGFERALLVGGDGSDTLDASGAPAALTVTLDGGEGSDSLVGGAGNDELTGDEGNDTLRGGAGNDLLGGGDGTDCVVEIGNFHFALLDATLTTTGAGGSADSLGSIETALLTGGSGANTMDASGFTLGPVTLNGAAGNDTLTGSAQADSLIGDAGNDSLIGLAGNDSLNGGAGNDAFNGGADNDRVAESANVNFTISANGLTGNGTDTFALDTVSGNSSIEEASLTGGTGNNTLTVNSFLGPVTLVGGAGNDTLIGGAVNDSLDGGLGTDLIILNNVDNITLTDSALSGSGNDTLNLVELARITVTLSALVSTINAGGFSGSITLIGGNGNDSITGGAGNDSLTGGAGNDELHGGLGLDTIDGGVGNDCIHGDNGNDKLMGGAGSDTMRGGAENDSLDGGADDDVLLGEAGNDTLLGGKGDAATDPFGSRGDDILLGGEGNDSLSGLDGNDTIFGGLGTDKLSGGNGNDVLSGDDGRDTLSGDGGLDSLFGGADIDSLSSGEVASQEDVFDDSAFFELLDDLLAAC